MAAEDVLAHGLGKEIRSKLISILELSNEGGEEGGRTYCDDLKPTRDYSGLSSNVGRLLFDTPIVREHLNLFHRDGVSPHGLG